MASKTLLWAEVSNPTVAVLGVVRTHDSASQDRVSSRRVRPLAGTSVHCLAGRTAARQKRRRRLLRPYRPGTVLRWATALGLEPDTRADSINDRSWPVADTVERRLSGNLISVELARSGQQLWRGSRPGAATWAGPARTAWRRRRQVRVGARAPKNKCFGVLRQHCPHRPPQ